MQTHADSERHCAETWPDFGAIGVGDYRIVCEIRDGELLVLVVAVGHRGDIYR